MFLQSFTIFDVGFEYFFMLMHDEVFHHFSNTHHCPFKSFTAIGMVCEAKSMCSRSGSRNIQRTTTQTNKARECMRHFSYMDSTSKSK